MGCLVVGDRGVFSGEEITLNYGDRPNDEWLLNYGFIPNRNTANVVVLPNQHKSNRRVVSWNDVQTLDPKLRKECSMYLEEECSTALKEDLAALQILTTMGKNLRSSSSINNNCSRMALEYRIARKTLLSAVAGV